MEKLESETEKMRHPARDVFDLLSTEFSPTGTAERISFNNGRMSQPVLYTCLVFSCKQFKCSQHFHCSVYECTYWISPHVTSLVDMKLSTHLLKLPFEVMMQYTHVLRNGHSLSSKNWPSKVPQSFNRIKYIRQRRRYHRECSVCICVPSRVN